MDKFLRIYLIVFFLMHVCTYSHAQKLTFKKKQADLKEVFNEIRKQTGYQILVRSELIDQIKPISVNFQNEQLELVLNTILANQPLDFSIEGKEIIITKKERPIYNMHTDAADTDPVMKQQTRIITGKVTDTLNKPIPGVSVRAANTRIVATTNNEGNYAIRVEDHVTTLEFSYVGMITQELRINNRTTINVVLRESSSMLNDVVITAYGGSTSIKNNTDATTRVDMKLLQENPSSNLMEILQGQIPGMMTMLGTGEPGEEPMVIMRGVSSLMGNLAPLMVINDIPMDDDFRIASLNPNDILSIDVLKGASAIAIYGSRGAGGVFMIKTKTGFSSAPTISYRLNYGIDKLMKPLEVLNSSEFKMLLTESITNRIRDENDYGNGAPINLNTHSYYTTFFNRGFFGEAETNWMDVLYQDGSRANHNLTITGKGAELGYNIGLGLTKTVGQVKKTGSDRNNIDIRIDSRQSKVVQFGIIANGAYQVTSSPVGNLTDALLMRPDMSPYNADGTIFVPPANSGYKNPLVDLEGIDRGSKMFSYNLAGNIQVNIMKGLKWNNILSTNSSNTKLESYYSNTTVLGSNNFSTVTPRTGRMDKGLTETRKYEVDSRLNYSRTFLKNHNVDLTAAFTYTRNRYYRESMSLYDFPEDDYLNAPYQAINPQRPTGDSYGSALVSGIFRVNYNSYRGRYLATLSIRRDGTSRMAPSTRFANFPAAALGWNIGETKLFKNIKAIQMLKLRASIGTMANTSVPAYGWMNTFDAASYNGQVGIIPKQVPNADLEWEVSTQYDMGLDFSLFKKFNMNGSIGYYKKMTKGALSNYDLPMSAGLLTTSTLANLIDINNQGIEFDISANLIRTRNTSLFVGFNAAKNTNKLMRMDAIMKRNSTFAATILKVGQPIGLFYGFRTAGLFRSAAEAAYYMGLNPGQQYQATHVAPGEIRMVDMNGNGWVDFGTGTANYTEADKEVLGKSFPDVYGGFNSRLTWKGISLSVQGSYSFGAQKNWSVMETQFQFASSNPKNLLKLNLNRWTPENPDGPYPKMLVNPLNDTRGFGRARPLTQYFNDYWIYDASYVRINNVSASYALSQKVLQKLKVVSNLNLGLSVNNVVTFTKYPGVNPEAFDRIDRIAGPAMDNSTYPQTRTFSFTLSASFKQ